MKHALYTFPLLTLLVVLAGCKTTPSETQAFGQPTAVIMTNQLPSRLLEPSDKLFTLGPGDAVQIEIAGETGSSATVPIGPDGRIYYYLLPGLDVWGLTLAQTEERLEKELSTYFATAPDVLVNLRAVGSRHVWLVGRVGRPGIYPITGPTTLLEALAMAGGAATSDSVVNTADLADLRHSFVMRGGEMLPVNFYRLLKEGDTSQNIYLEPDDFVFVPSSLGQEIYVFGAVRRPQAVPFSDNSSLVAAIANAGDATPDAYLSHVAIVRGSLSEPEMIVVDYKAVRKGQAPDVRLEPRDIVYVPNSPYRILREYFDMIVDTFARTVAANEGALFAGRNAPIGVSVPVTQ